MNTEADGIPPNSLVFNRLMKSLGCHVRASPACDQRETFIALHDWLDKNEFNLVQGILEYRLRIARSRRPA